MTMPPITLIQYPGLSSGTTMSPPCAKVHMALRLKGLPYQIKNLRTPNEARRYNPRGRVPALLLGAETIVDSTDILTALDARFPDPPLEPDDPLERARAKILEDWADEVLYFYGVYTRFAVPENFARLKAEVFSRMPPPLRWIIPPLARRMLLQRIRGQGVGLKEPEVVRREAAECLQALAQLLSSSAWLAGKRLSRADIAGCACLDQYRLRQLTPDLAAAIEAHPQIVEWMDRVHELAPSAAS
jgi:glutathione S-transferase